jgi:hypothetical protein
MRISDAANSLDEITTMLVLNQLSKNYSTCAFSFSKFHSPPDVCPGLNVTFLLLGVTGAD